MQTIDPLTPAERRLKNKLATLDRLTDLRKRADKLRETLAELIPQQHRAAALPHEQGRAYVCTDHMAVRRGSGGSGYIHPVTMGMHTIKRVLDVMIADLTTQLNIIVEEMDTILDGHCEGVRA